MEPLTEALAKACEQEFGHILQPSEGSDAWRQVAQGLIDKVGLVHVMTVCEYVPGTWAEHNSTGHNCKLDTKPAYVIQLP